MIKDISGIPQSPNIKLFEKYDSKQILGEENGITYAVGNVLPVEDAEKIFNDVIEQGFAVINDETGARQSMTEEEFQADALSKSVLKFTAEDNGKTVAVLTVHVGLEEVTWVDGPSVMAIQELIDPNAPPLYIGTIVVDPNFTGIDRIGTKLASYALNEQITLLLDHGAKSAVFFDCVWRNVPGVPRMVQMAVNQVPGGKDRLKVVEWKNDSGRLVVNDFSAKDDTGATEGHRCFAVIPT